MKSRHTYDYARPALTADAVVFGYNGKSLHVLLIQRAIEPYKGKWALPGGFCREGETTPVAAYRELKEEAGIRAEHLEQFGVFDRPGRDPRGWVVSVAFLAFVHQDRVDAPKGGTDAAKSAWFPLTDLPALCFDHEDILAAAILQLREKTAHSAACFSLLPTEFTLSEVQNLYEAILGRTLDKRNFRRLLLATGALKPTGGQSSGPGRPAALYQITQTTRKAPTGFFLKP